MELYLERMSALGFRLVGLLALSLGLDDTFFDEAFTDPTATIRLLHYASVTSQPDAGVFACGAHSDYGMLTLLLTDGPGLQILAKDTGEWVDVPHVPNAFVVNLGDMLERWTNGLYRSTPHRVLTTASASGEEGKNDRYSIPFFYEPNFDAVVKCLDVCCSDTNPPKYEPTTSGQHLLGKYKETHADFAPDTTAMSGMSTS